MPTEAARVPAPSTSASSRRSATADDGEGGSLRVLRPRRAAPDHVVRPTRAEVDLTALRHNLRQLERAAGAAKVWAVLKADGYGHGAPAVARTLERAGVDGVAVALLEEAIELRDAGIRAPILVMGGYYGDAYEELLAHDLVPVVYHVGHLAALARASRTRGLEGAALRVHLKVDTGMARLGVRPGALPDMLEALAAFPQISVDGLMTHLACADAADPAGDESVRQQLAAFDRAVATVRAAGHTPRWLHAGNSAALLRSGATFDARYAAVRPGIALFGGVASTLAAGAVDLHPTLRLRSEIVDLRTLEPGEGVGYGHTFRAPARADGRGTVIATVPMGYADGLPRTLSSKDGAPGFPLLVRGHRAPIVGAVSMDLVTLDVTDVPGVRLRDEVVALGAATPERTAKLGRPASIGIEDLARAAGLIPWDVMTSISRRVPRFYRT